MFDEREGTDWTISWAWAANPRLIGILLVLLSLLGLALCLGAHVYAVVSTEPEALVLAGFATPIFAALLIFGVAVAANRTRLSLSAGSLRVYHSPVRWGNQFEVAAHSIDQVITVMDRFRGQVVFAVVIAQTDGPLRKLGHGFARREEAVYLARALKRRLTLSDQEEPVRSLVGGTLFTVDASNRMVRIGRWLTVAYWAVLTLLGLGLLLAS